MHCFKYYLFVIATILGLVSCQNKPYCKLCSTDSVLSDSGLYVYRDGIRYESNDDEKYVVFPKSESIVATRLQVGADGDLRKTKVTLPISDLFEVERVGNYYFPNKSSDIGAVRMLDGGGIELTSNTKWPGEKLLFFKQSKQYYLVAFSNYDVQYSQIGEYYIKSVDFDNPYLGEYLSKSRIEILKSITDDKIYRAVTFPGNDISLGGRHYIKFTYMSDWILKLDSSPNSKEAAKTIYEESLYFIRSVELSRSAQKDVERYRYINVSGLRNAYKANSVQTKRQFIGPSYIFDITLESISEDDNPMGRYCIYAEAAGGAVYFHTNHEYYVDFQYPVRVLLIAAIEDITDGYSFSIRLNGSYSHLIGFVAGEQAGEYSMKSTDGIYFSVPKP